MPPTGGPARDNREVSKKSAGQGTPALVLVTSQSVPHVIHEYEHDPRSELSFGMETAEKLGISPERVFKTLMAEADATICVGVVPASGQLNLKALAAALGAKKAEMIAPELAEKVTGYVVGGISPLGQKRAHPTVIDSSALDHETILVSGGRRGLSLELAPRDLARLIDARFGPIGR